MRGPTASDPVYSTVDRPSLIEERCRIIRPAKRRIKVRDLPGTAPVVRVVVARDFKVRYQQSIVGPAWLIFQPLALLAAFLVAFKGVGDASTAHVPYVVFALCGLAAWSFFQAAMTIGTPSMISNLNLVKSTPCPRIALLAAGVISSLPSFAVTAGAAAVSAALTGQLSIRLLLLPAALIWLLLLTLGILGVLASIAVRYRDVVTALPFLLQVGAFVAPVGYGLNALSPGLRTVVELNPITGVIETLRWMILRSYPLDLTPIALSLGLTFLISTLGWRTFAARETTMADVI